MLNRDLVVIVTAIISIILMVLGILAYIVYIIDRAFYLLVNATGVGASLGYAVLFLLSMAGLFFIVGFVVMMWMVILNE